jgi:hypothetical protein
MNSFINCIYCSKVNSDPSKEHIIPQSIGGRISTKNCCRDCNSNFGTKYDSFIASLPIYTQFTDILNIGSKFKRGIPLKLQTSEGMKLSVQVSKDGIRVKGKTTMINNEMLTDDIKIIETAVKNGKKLESIEKRTVNLAEILASKDHTYAPPPENLLIGSHRKIVLGLTSLVFNEDEYLEKTALLRVGLKEDLIHKAIQLPSPKYKPNLKAIAHCLRISIEDGYLSFFLTMFGSFHILFAQPVNDIKLSKSRTIWVSPIKNRYQIYEDESKIFDSKEI